MKKCNRVLALALAALMLFSMLPAATAFAAATDGQRDYVTNRLGEISSSIPVGGAYDTQSYNEVWDARNVVEEMLGDENQYSDEEYENALSAFENAVSNLKPSQCDRAKLWPYVEKLDEYLGEHEGEEGYPEAKQIYNEVLPVYYYSDDQDEIDSYLKRIKTILGENNPESTAPEETYCTEPTADEREAEWNYLMGLVSNYSMGIVEGVECRGDIYKNYPEFSTAYQAANKLLEDDTASADQLRQAAESLKAAADKLEQVSIDNLPESFGEQLGTVNGYPVVYRPEEPLEGKYVRKIGKYIFFVDNTFDTNFGIYSVTSNPAGFKFIPLQKAYDEKLIDDRELEQIVVMIRTEIRMHGFYTAGNWSVMDNAEYKYDNIKNNEVFKDVDWIAKVGEDDYAVLFYAGKGDLTEKGEDFTLFDYKFSDILCPAECHNGACLYSAAKGIQGLYYFHALKASSDGYVDFAVAPFVRIIRAAEEKGIRLQFTVKHKLGEDAEREINVLYKSGLVPQAFIYYKSFGNFNVLISTSLAETCLYYEKLIGSYLFTVPGQQAPYDIGVYITQNNRTVTFDSNSAAEDDYAWFAYTRSSSGEGHWLNGKKNKDGKYTFEGVLDYVKFVRMPYGATEGSLENNWNTTANLKVEGSYFKVTGWEEATIVGEWSGEANPVSGHGYTLEEAYGKGVITDEDMDRAAEVFSKYNSVRKLSEREIKLTRDYINAGIIHNGEFGNEYIVSGFWYGKRLSEKTASYGSLDFYRFVDTYEQHVPKYVFINGWNIQFNTDEFVVIEDGENGNYMPLENYIRTAHCDADFLMKLGKLTDYEVMAYKTEGNERVFAGYAESLDKNFSSYEYFEIGEVDGYTMFCATLGASSMFGTKDDEYKVEGKKKGFQLWFIKDGKLCKITDVIADGVKISEIKAACDKSKAASEYFAFTALGGEPYKYQALLDAVNKEQKSSYTEDDLVVSTYKELSDRKYLVQYYIKGIPYNDLLKIAMIDGYYYCCGAMDQAYIFDGKSLTEIDEAFDKSIINKTELKAAAKILDSLKENKETVTAGKDHFSSSTFFVTSSKIKSSDTKVIKVNKDGTLTALTKGKATVSYKKNGKKTVYAVITVKNNPKLAKSSVSVKKGGTVKVKISGKAASVNNTYKSTKYAKITSKKTASTLTIKGLKRGSTTLKVKVNGKWLSIKVRVK